MVDVTDVFDAYRECARHLWNTYFRPLATSADEWDVRDEFDEVARALFNSLVLRKLGIRNSEIARSSDLTPKPLVCFQVTSGGSIPISINREVGTHHGYWDHPMRFFDPSDGDLLFVRFFDFGETGFREYAYYEVTIQNSLKHSEIVGRAALISCEHAKIVMKCSGASGDSKI